MKKIFLVFIAFFSVHLACGNAIWHWHKGNAFTASDLEILSMTGFSEIFIHAGYYYLFGRNGDRLPEFSGFEFDDGFTGLKERFGNFNIHLCFTFESWGEGTFYRQYMLKNSGATEFILSVIDNQIKQFAAHGIAVKGIQLDLEDYEVSLSYYAKLLAAVKKRFPGYIISITPMVRWLDEAKFKDILKSIDFYVPMVYDFQRGKNLDDDTRITDIAWIESVVQKCELLKFPYYFGLPSYYYRIHYNDKEERVRSWTFVDFEEISDNKAFELVKSRQNYVIGNEQLLNGDNIYIYKVKLPVFFKFYYFPENSYLLYNVITPQGLKAYKDAVAGKKPKFSKGICVFRFTKDSEPYLIKTSYYPFIFAGQSLVFEPTADFIFERPEEGGGLTFYTALKNAGNSESYVENNATQFLIKMSNAKLKSIVKNSFDNYDHYFEEESSTTYLTLTERFLGLNEELTSGPITIENANTLPISIKYQIWIKGPDGAFSGIDLESWKEVDIK